MQTYTYPQSAELRVIDQGLLPSLVLNDPIFDLFPIRGTQSARVVWEQRDNYLGLQQGRGYNGMPASVPLVGSKRYNYDPGVYGEFDRVDEYEMTNRAQFGTWHVPISIDDLVTERAEKLQHRQVNRMRWILWTLLVTSMYLVTDVKGALIQADSFIPQLFASVILWSVPATATPLADFRNVQLLHRGTSATFGASASALMNQKTFNYMISNTNQSDLAGQRKEGLANIQSLSDYNKLAMNDGLPKIMIYDEGYLDSTGTFQLWIPDGTVIVVGKRLNGASIGEFLLTRCIVNPDNSSTPYLKVVEKGMAPGQAPPPVIEVHRGFNGGPAIYYPGAVVVMKVA